jgi:hypothetical protein
MTGIVFTLIVTRSLSQEEFGLWTLLGSMISYVIIFEPLISFWTSRQIARGMDVGKTAMLTSGLLSSVAFFVFLGISFYVSNLTQSDIGILLLSSALVPLTFISNTLAGINLGHKPQAVSFGIAFFEISKIPVGLGLVYFLDLGLYGAVAATIAAFIAKIIIQLHFAKPKLAGIINKQVILYWIKFSWLPLYGIAPSFIWTLDVLIYSSIVGSVVGLSFFGAIMAIGNIIIHSSMISQALYPKLLSEGKTEYIKDNFARFLYFAIPLFILSILFSRAGLFALNPVYASAFLIAAIYSTRSFFYATMGTFNRIIQGLEKVDESEITKFSLLIKSKLFTIPTMDLIHYSSYIISITAMLIVLIPQGISELDLIMWWVTISLIIQIPFTVISAILVRRQTKFIFPIIDVSKYVIGSVAMILLFYLTSESILIYDKSIFVFFPRLVLEVCICGISYLVTTWLIDKKTRILFGSIIKEISTRNKST